MKIMKLRSRRQKKSSIFCWESGVTVSSSCTNGSYTWASETATTLELVFSSLPPCSLQLASSAATNGGVQHLLIVLVLFLVKVNNNMHWRVLRFNYGEIDTSHDGLWRRFKKYCNNDNPKDQHESFTRRDDSKSQKCQFSYRFFSSQTPHSLLVSILISWPTVRRGIEQRYVAYHSYTFQRTQGHQDNSSGAAFCEECCRWQSFVVSK